MKGSFVVCLALAVATSSIACGSSRHSKKVSGEVDGGDASPPRGAGGKTGAGGAAAGAAGAGGSSGGRSPGTGGSSSSDAGPGSSGSDAAADASTQGDACSPTPDDKDPPLIVSVAKVAPNQIELALSEPVKIDGVDPKKFRLSIGYIRNPGTPQEDTTYEDLSQGVLSGSVEVTSMAGDCTDSLVLGLSADVGDPQICDRLELLSAQSGARESGLFLHYSATALPTIRDPSGNVLPAAAPAWVGSGTAPLQMKMQFPGHYPDGPIRIDVGCTPDGGAP